MPIDKSPASRPLASAPNSGPQRAQPDGEVYSPIARALHWLTVLMVAVMIPVGLFMTSRAERNIWDGLTNSLYSGHKLAGIVLLALMLGRLAYRLGHGAPADEPSIEPWQKTVSHMTHWALYALLLAVPVLGWVGISLYPALDIFELFKLPGLVAPNQPASSMIFQLHKIGAFALAGLAVMHVGAALYHYVVRKDGVLLRMLPGLPRRDR